MPVTISITMWYSAIEISIINSYNKQGSIHEIISFLNSHGFELFNIYKAIRKKGRLLEIDGMFVRKDLLPKFNHKID